MSRQRTDMDDITPIEHAFSMHSEHYDNGGADYSVTSLLNPTRIVHLEKRHLHKVKLTVEQQVASLMGTAMHDYLEKMLHQYNKKLGVDVYKTEERLSVTVDGKEISGAYDIVYYTALSMWDLKTTKCATLMRNKGLKSDWTKQQNMYRYIYHVNHNVTIPKMNIIGLYWDWSKYGVFQVKDKSQKKYYPKNQITRIELPVWSFEKTLKFMEDKVEDLVKHELTPDNKLPLCTSEEMWADPDKWAVKLKGKAKALTAQCLSKEEAEDYIIEHQYNSDGTKLADYTIEFRPARRLRCEDWCPCNQYCSQWHKYNAVKGGK